MYFVGGFVGEGDGEDCLWWYLFDFGELVDVVGEYVGFVGIGVG